MCVGEGGGVCEGVGKLKKILIGNRLNSMMESPTFYLFSCVSHLERNKYLTFRTAIVA